MCVCCPRDTRRTWSFFWTVNELYFRTGDPYLPRHIAKALESDDREALDSAYNRLRRQARFIEQIPMVRIVEKVKKWKSKNPEGEVKAAADNDSAMAVIKRYLVGNEIISGLCKGLNITPLFVWQPIPTFKMNKEFVLFSLGIEEHALSAVGYPLMQRYIHDLPPDPDFLWAADIQNDLKSICMLMGFIITQGCARCSPSLSVNGFWPDNQFIEPETSVFFEFVPGVNSAGIFRTEASGAQRK